MLADREEVRGAGRSDQVRARATARGEYTAEGHCRKYRRAPPATRSCRVETVERDLVKQSRPVAVKVERLAARPEQIEEYGLITQPVTRTDSRARKFMERFGNKTVELDAIPASEARRLVREAIERHMDPRRLALLRMVEHEEREGIRALFGGLA